MTIEEKRKIIEDFCFEHDKCDKCPLNEFTERNKTCCFSSEVSNKTVENNYNYLFGDTENIKEDTDRINSEQIKNLLYLQAQIDNAIREFANTILRGKQVSNEEIKDRIVYIVNEEMRER